jgi:hypothetical protein
MYKCTLLKPYCEKLLCRFCALKKPIAESPLEFPRIHSNAKSNPLSFVLVPLKKNISHEVYLLAMNTPVIFLNEDPGHSVPS